MAFFLPSFFQKRILRYALSRLGLLDTDALDLERLDIAWGKKSTIELRDVGVHTRVSTCAGLPRLSCTGAEQVLTYTETCRFTSTARRLGHLIRPDSVSSAHHPRGPLQQRYISGSARRAGARERKPRGSIWRGAT